MSRNDFDELLRKKMNEEELDYNPAHWEQLVQKLPQERGITSLPLPWYRKLGWPAGIAAAVLLAVAAAFFWFDMPQNNAPTPIVQKSAQPQLPNNAPKNNNPEPDHTVTTPFLQPATYAGTPSGITDRLPSRPNNTSYVTIDKEREEGVKSDQFPSSSMLQPQQQETTLMEDSKTSQIVAAPKDNFSLPKSSTSNPDPYFNAYTLVQQQAEGRTSLAVGGGVNYGTFKTGVTFGISARQYIGKNVFVDGTVAMNINQGNDNTLHYTGNVMSDLFSGNNNARSRPSGHFYQATDFYYIQINPTLGYKLGRIFSLSAGPDFQQLLRDGSDKAIMFMDDGVKIIPDMDMGLTGKAEFSITPNIQSGIIYREGLNNFIRNNDNYLNRRYIQVQMRFTVPLNK
jgi:hypothetical protein